MTTPKITAVLLNYKRPQNISIMIESIRKQSVPIKIMLWHNGVGDDIPGADWVLRSSRNMGCLARWHLAALADADYVFTLDDDLAFTENDFIERCVAISKQYDDTKIIGKSGKVLGKWLRKYTRGPKPKGDQDSFVDIVKGRFMFVPSKLLSLVPLVFKGYQGRGDDIWISLLTGREQQWHVLPNSLSAGIRELDGNGVGLSDQSTEHLIKREKIVAKIFDHNFVAWFPKNIETALCNLFWLVFTRLKKLSDHRGDAPGSLGLKDPSTSMGDIPADWVIESSLILDSHQRKTLKEQMVALSGARQLKIICDGKKEYFELKSLNDKKLLE